MSEPKRAFDQEPRPADDRPPQGPPDSILEKPDSILEKVVRETITQPPPSATADWQAMQLVARRHAGEPLTPEPVGGELVEEILRRRLPLDDFPPEALREMVSTVTDSLFEHPDIVARMENLWSKLCESVKS